MEQGFPAADILAADNEKPQQPQPEVRLFWTGPQLSPYEELSLASFVAAGARVFLYSRDKTLRLPDGVERVDLDELLTGELHHFTFPDGDRSAALHSDLFRYMAIEQFGGWYADLDVICIGDRLPDCKVYLARESEWLINGAVMKFPPHAPFITAAIEESIKLLPDAAPGAPISARISIGPELVTRLVKDYALDHLILPRANAYEITYDEIPLMFDPRFCDELNARVAGKDFVHLWNEIWRRVRIPKSYGPPAGSFLDGLFRRFGIEFPEEGRLSAQTIGVWFREREILSQLQYRLDVDVIPMDALDLIVRQGFDFTPRTDTSVVPAGRMRSLSSVRAPQTIRTFWHGGALGAYQLLCLRSFIDRGHHVEVYSYDQKLQLPVWLERKDAALIIPAERVLRQLNGPHEPERLAIHGDLFRCALLHRLGGWWIDPDVILLADELPSAAIFFSGPTAFNQVSTAALKFPNGHPVFADALIQATAFDDKIEAWSKAGARALTQLILASDAASYLKPAEQVAPISWFDVACLFDPDQADALEAKLVGKIFLDLHRDAWLRAGIPDYLGPPRESWLDRQFRRYAVGVQFAEQMEFRDVRRWLAHMYACSGARPAAGA
jgi:hypothetical protein